MRTLGLFKVSLRYRFMLSMALMLLPLLAVAWSAVSSLHSQRLLMEQIVQEILHEKEPIMLLQERVHQAVILLTHQLQDGRRDGDRRFAEISRDIEEAFIRAEDLPFALKMERVNLGTARMQWQSLKVAATAVFSRPITEETTRAELFSAIYTAHGKISRVLQVLQEMANLEIAEAQSDIVVVEKRTAWAVWTTFAVGFFIVVLVGMRLARSVLNPMRAIGLSAKQLASGNLDHRIAGERQDEFGALVKTFNEMAASLQEGQNALRELAVRDPLTGLFNHREFFRLLHEEVDRACRYDHPLSLLMMDMDKFKEINDTLGHLAGDQVLHHVAEIIGRRIRKSDHASRYGGDEFAVLLPETDLAEAFDFAERLQQATVALPLELDTGEKLTVSFSIGVASFPEDAATAMQLVDASDHALYRAKQSRTQRVCCRRNASD